MNVSGSDELPKFVITSRVGKLPAAVLVAAMSQQVPSYSEVAAEHAGDRQHGPLSRTQQQMTWSRQMPPFQNASPPRGSPRERRMTVQASSSSDSSHHTSHTSQHVSSPNVSTIACPYPTVPVPKLQLQFPKEWGAAPCKLSPVRAQLPEGYGVGSVTLRSWMIHRLHDMCPTAATHKGIYDIEAGSESEQSISSPPDALLMRAKAWARRNGHPDVPWAPGGSSWSDYKGTFELECQRRRNEANTRPAAVEPSPGPPVAPIVPPLLLEPIRDLLAARNKQNRPVTPLSTRHLQHQLRHCSTSRLSPEQRAIKEQRHQAQRAAPPNLGQHVRSADEAAAGTSSLPERGTPHDAPDPTIQPVVELPMYSADVGVTLAPVSHAAALTQRLMRLSSVKRRLMELCALSEHDKMEAAALISQRAKIVQQLRSHKSPVETRRRQLELHDTQPAAQQPWQVQHPGHHEVNISDLQPPPPPSQLLQQPLLLMRHMEQHSRQPVAIKHKSRPPPASASGQRLWLTATVHACAVSLFRNLIQHDRNCKTEAQMRHWAAVKIQKMLRWKLVISQTLNPKP